MKFQGAEPIYSVSTLHLDEIAFRYALGLITDEQLSKIMNPSNPVNPTNEDRFAIRMESRMPIILTDSSVSSIFKLKWSRNRTIINTSLVSFLEKEKFYKRVSELVEGCFPDVLLGVKSILGTAVGALESRIVSAVKSSSLDNERKMSS